MLHVPAALGDDQAAMIEPLAVATHDVRRAEVKAGNSVLVLGGGPIGAVIAMVCRHRGARVIVSEVNPFPFAPSAASASGGSALMAAPGASATGWTAARGVARASR